ncbi:MAG: GNAT family N-acetyltransferase [Acidobacteriota bacterium]
MPLHNLLEPVDLPRLFRAHPPANFQAIDSIAPAFAAKFDLLTTLEPTVRNFLGRLPLGGLRRPLTCFIGTTVSEHALFPSEVEPEAFVRTILTDHAPCYAFLIIKDIPTEAVLVGEEALTYSRGVAAACELADFVLVDGQALAYVPIDFGTVDEYMTRFSHTRRKSLRRKLRNRRAVTVEAIATGDERFLKDEFVSSIVRLYRNVFAQSEIHFDLLTEDFFRAVLQSVTVGGTLFVYRTNGAMIGWNLCVAKSGILVDKYIGFDYPAAREYDLYALSWFHNLEHAVQRGFRYYVAGWTDPEVKRQLGAQFTPTMHAVRVRSPLLRSLLKRSKRWFEPDRRWYATDAANTRP